MWWTTVLVSRTTSASASSSRWCPDGRGSGLGLTLAQTFVQQHDGLIECDSRPGLTDFRILVPLH